MQLVLRRKSRKGNVTVGRGGSIFGGDTLYRSWNLAGSKKKMQSIRAVIVGSSTLCSKSFTHAYKSSASRAAALRRHAAAFGKIHT